MSNYNCSTCRWWVQNESENDGECRKNPPVPYLTRNLLGETASGGLFPCTSYNDFCGAHDMSIEHIKHGLSDDDLIHFITDSVGTDVRNLELNRADGCIIGRITLGKPPTSEDRDLIESFLSTKYEFVDISVIGD